MWSNSDVSQRSNIKTGATPHAIVATDSSHITAHPLRHTAVTLSLIGGASAEEAQVMARHADISATMVYAHYVTRLNNAAEEKISRVIDE